MTHKHDTREESAPQTFSCDIFKNFYHAWNRDSVEKELSERMAIHWDSCASCMTWAYDLKNAD